MTDINNPYRDPRTGMSIYQVEMMERERQRMMYQMAESQRIAEGYARQAASQSRYVEDDYYDPAYDDEGDRRDEWVTITYGSEPVQGWRAFVYGVLFLVLLYVIAWVIGFVANGFQV